MCRFLEEYRRKVLYFAGNEMSTGRLGGNKMAKILITGGAGYIGSHTALELLKEGYEVVVYDNLCNSSRESLKRVEELTGKSITFYEGDVMDETALKAMMEKEGVDAVINIFFAITIPPIFTFTAYIIIRICNFPVHTKNSTKYTLFSSGHIVF